jgi:hypothetical protein
MIRVRAEVSSMISKGNRGAVSAFKALKPDTIPREKGAFVPVR